MSTISAKDHAPSYGTLTIHWHDGSSSELYPVAGHWLSGNDFVVVRENIQHLDTYPADEIKDWCWDWGKKNGSAVNGDD